MQISDCTHTGSLSIVIPYISHSQSWSHQTHEDAADSTVQDVVASLWVCCGMKRSVLLWSEWSWSLRHVVRRVCCGRWESLAMRVQNVRAASLCAAASAYKSLVFHFIPYGEHLKCMASAKW